VDERIQIDGFYEHVRDPNEFEEELLRSAPDSSGDLRSAFGLESLLGGQQDVNRAYFSPTCNIAGIESGYQGEGPKTVIPAIASAKIDFRLVPDQDPVDILAKLRRHLDTSGFSDVAIDLLGAEPPATTDGASQAVRLSAAVAEDVYGKAPNIYPLSGGTTPMYLFTRQGMPVIAPGVGWDQRNRAHSPNEFMRIRDFQRAASHIARFLVAFADQ
jgi:acetylornithine deacetylase/succinyl-diaminopimelate desuccinylase-like protein